MNTTRLLVLTLALAAAASALIPPAAGHDAHQNEGLDEQLVEAGEGLMVGGFDAPQQGPLVVVPFTKGHLPCGRVATNEYVLPVGNGTVVSFAQNATHVQASLAMPANTTGYAAVALDTASAHRSIMMMLEHAVAVHALGAVVLDAGPNATISPAFDQGLMGVPYLVPDAETKATTSKYFIDLPMPGDGIRMEHGLSAPVSWCAGDGPGQFTFRFERWSMRKALGPGSIVHAVVLWDHELPAWLPRPISTTDELQVNLYLARPGERPDAVRAALDPAPTVQSLLAIVGVVGASGWMLGRWEP